MRTLFSQPMEDHRHMVKILAGSVDKFVPRGAGGTLFLGLKDGTISIDLPTVLDCIVEQPLKVDVEFIPSPDGTILRPLLIRTNDHATPVRRFIVVSDEWGVYLGSCMGLGFWSAMDPVGQDAAITFASESEADQFIGRLFKTVDRVPPTRILPVDVTGDYASIEACVAAGASAWDPAPGNSTEPNSSSAV